MARIELNIVALGDFSSVTSQIKSLQLQVDALNKGVAGVGLGPQLAKDLNSAQAAFKSTMLSTGQFTMQTVAMRSETEKFGASLVAGKLKLSDYFNIITGKAGQAKVSMDALAESQIKLQNSVVVQNKQGFLDVYTPTSFNKVAQAEDLVTMKAALMQKAINGGSTALLNFGKNTQWAGRQLTVGLTMPMVMFGAVAVKSFKDTNTELTRLQRLYGEGLTPPSQAQLNQISSQVLNLGKQVAQQMGIAQTETVKVAANFAAMGRQGKDLLDITYQTQRLSKLGAVDATQATNTIVALQNVYKVSTNDLAGAVNFLSDIQKQTTMTLGDMTEAIPRVGPIMKELGGTYKETAVMLVAMREAGIPASQAANALKSAMASIIAPTSAATKEFATFGINLTALKSAGGPVQMIESLQASLAKLTPLARETLIEKLFGKMQYGRISALLDNFGKAGSQTINALKIAGATSSQLATLANQEMKQATGSVSAQWTRTLESFKATLYPIGQKFVEMGTIVLGVADKIGNAFSKLPSPIKGFFGFLVIGAALAGPLIMLTGLLANFASYLLRGVGLIQKLATGGMTIKELLTPEIMASQKAAELFSDKMANDVDAVDLLNQAVERLTTSLASMSNAMSSGTADVALTNAADAALVRPLNVKSQSKIYGEMTVQEFRALAKQNNGLEGRYKSGSNKNPAFSNLPSNEVVYAKPNTGVFANTQVAGATNEALANGGVESSLYIKAMTDVTGEVNDYAGKFKTSTSVFLDALTEQTITLENGTKKTVLSEEQAYSLKTKLNKAFEAQIISLGKITDINNPLAAVEKDIMLELESMASELGLSVDQIRMLTNQMRTGMSNIFDTTGRAGGGNAWLGGEGTGIERFEIKLQGLKEENIEFWHAFNEDAQQAWNNILTKLRNAGAEIDQQLADELLSQVGVILNATEEAGTKAGLSYVASLQEQIDKTLGIGLSESAIKSAEASASVFEEAGASSGTAWYSGFISKAKTSMGMGTGTLGKGGGMGIAMAGTMAGMSMSSSKNSTVNTLGTGITAGANAAMMASFLPMDLTVPVIGEIMAGVTAAAIGIKMLIKHMDDVKAHNAEVAASFQSSSDVISAYGGTMITATQAVYNFNTANKESSTVLSQTAKDVAEINKLKPTDSLRQIGDLLKGGTSAKGVIGTVEQYAAAQVAAGMDPKAVSQMVTDLLTYSGQTQYLSAALKEITTNTQDMTTATTTWLNKLKNNGDANIITAKSYKDMSTEQKAYADGLLLQTNIISDQNTPFQTVIDKLKALSASSDSSGVAVTNFALALKNSGADAASVAESYNLVAMGITNMGTAASVYMLNAAGFKVDSKTAAGLTQQMKTAIPTYVLTQQKKAEDAAKAKLATDIAQKNKDEKALNAANSPDAQLSKNQKDAVDALGKAEADSYFKAQSKVKVLDAQLTVQKQITSELQAQQQYQLSQAQIDSQIRTAVASGDFMQASLLRQQKSANTVKYNGDTSTQQMQDQVDALKAQIDTDDALISARQSLVTGSSSGLSGDIATITLDQASLDAIKKAGSNTNIITQINELFKSSGLDFKAFFDKNNVMHVEIDKSIPLTVGGPQAPSGAANNAISFDQNTYKKTMDALTNKSGQPYDQSLKNWNASIEAGSGATRQGVKTFANAKGIKDGQSFSITQNGKVYEFIMGKDPVTGVGTSGNVTLVSDQGKPGQTWNGSSWISPTKKAIGGHIVGPGTATSDSIPAYLSNGEYVVKADSVKHYGTEFFDSVNAKRFAKGGIIGAAESIWRFLNKTKPVMINGKSVTPLGAMDMPFGPENIMEFSKALDLITKVGKTSASDVMKLIESGTFTDKQIGAGLAKKYAEGNYDVLNVPNYQKYVNTLKEKTTGDMWRGIGVGLRNGYPKNLDNGLPQWLNQSVSDIKKIHNTRTMSLAEKRRESGGLLDSLLGKEFIMGPRSWSADKSVARKFAESATKTPIGMDNGLSKFLLKTSIHNTRALNISKLFPDLTYGGGQAMNEAESVFGGKFKIDRSGIDGLILKQVFGKVNGGMIKMPSFDVGTNFVPHDMIAQIHKGERIIPASQNNGTMGSTYNITVNAGSNASADDIAKVVMDTIKRNTGMTNTNRRVSV